jgi:rare lipoprotein A
VLSRAKPATQPAPSAPVLAAEMWDGQGKCEGIASFYAGKFIGRRTANGERYTGRKLTAAHRVLPFGTFVKVTRLDNGLSVIVRINDRGPYIDGRIIDLSPAAAKRLHMISTGVTQVKLEIVAPWMAEE